MNILIVDDHPMIVSFYENALKYYFHKILNIYKAYNCQEAYNGLFVDYDIAIIDASLPPYVEKDLHSGADIALLIGKVNPSCKIVIITGFDKKLILYNLFRQIRPDAIIAKNDISAENFIEIITDVLDGKKYQSPTVKNSISEIWANDILADEHNRDILFNLSNGYKINELNTIVPLAEITIRKRLSLIKKAFQIGSKDNLLTEIKRRGIL